MAVNALRGELKTAQMAKRYGIHQTMVSDWRHPATEGMAAVFLGRRGEVKKLHSKIGQLPVERDSIQGIQAMSFDGGTS